MTLVSRVGVRRAACRRPQVGQRQSAQSQHAGLEEIAACHARAIGRCAAHNLEHENTPRGQEESWQVRTLSDYTSPRPMSRVFRQSG